MSLYSRFKGCINSKINKILDKFEDPREVLDYSYEQMNDQLKMVRQALVQLVAAKNQLKHQKELAEKNVETLIGQAKELVKLGGEDNDRLARLALEQKAVSAEHIIALDAQIKELDLKEAKLIQAEKEFELKVEQFNAQKEMLKAQYTAAESQVKIDQSLHGIGDDAGNAGDAMRRATDKTVSMTAQASAIDELVEKGVLTDPLDQRSSIEKELSKVKSKAQVEDEFARLKAEAEAGEEG